MSDKYSHPAGQPVDDPMVARSADRTYEWGPADIQRKRFPNQPPLYDPSRGRKIKINKGDEAQVGDHLEDFGHIHRIVKISKDGRMVTTDSPRGRREYHVSAFAHTFKVPPPAEKSEPRAAILARSILAAVELRKSLQKTDEHAQQPGESFGAYAHRHAKRWAQERAGLAEPEADAYAQHFVSTYPEGLDESGNSIDHPVAYRSWQEQSAPPAPASAPPRQKPPRKKPAAVPSGKIAWMHGQRPK